MIDLSVKERRLGMRFKWISVRDADAESALPGRSVVLYVSQQRRHRPHQLHDVRRVGRRRCRRRRSPLPALHAARP